MRIAVTPEITGMVGLGPLWRWPVSADRPVLTGVEGGGACWYQDRDLMAVVFDGAQPGITAWDGTTPRLVSPGQPNDLQAAGDHWLASTSVPRRTWGVVNGQAVDRSDVSLIALSADGTYVVAGEGTDWQHEIVSSTGAARLPYGVSVTSVRDGYVMARAGLGVAVYDTAARRIEVSLVAGETWPALALRLHGVLWLAYVSDTLGMVLHPASDASHGILLGTEVYGLDVREIDGEVWLAWATHEGDRAGDARRWHGPMPDLVPLSPMPPVTPPIVLPPIPPIEVPPVPTIPPPVPPSDAERLVILSDCIGGMRFDAICTILGLPPSTTEAQIVENRPKVHGWIAGKLATLNGYYQQLFGRPVDNEGAGSRMLKYTDEGYTDQQMFTMLGGVTPIPVPPAVPRPTHADVVFVQANFCNLSDSKGRPMFDPFLLSLPPEEREDWYRIHRDNGSTHLYIAPNVHYDEYTNRYGIPPSETLHDPAAFRAYVEEVLSHPSATGRGFVPIIFMDEGGAHPRSRIDTYWAPLLEALRDVLPYCIIVAGWELVKASEWTSADLSYGLKAIQAIGVDHHWWHGSQGRACGSSNPVEPDDPWQGGEKDFWYTHGGEDLEGMLYQSYTVRDGETLDCDPASDDCWINRWLDVIPRLSLGMNGWRVVHLCLAEGPAYYFTRGQCSSATAREWATIGKRHADALGARVGFGNGLPSQ